MLKFIVIISISCIWASCIFSQPKGCDMNYNKWCKSLKDPFKEDRDCNTTKVAKKYDEACKFVDEHNKKVSAYKLRVNHFFHVPISTAIPQCIIETLKQTPNKDVGFFNWYDSLRILKKSKVRNQGICESCYAIAAVDSVQAWYAIHENKSVELSVWNVAECTRQCAGGQIDKALRHLQMTKHVTETESPYKIDLKSKGGSCRNSSVPNPHFKYAALTDASDDSIIKILKVHGPIAMAMHSDIYDIVLYDSGVFDHPKCKPGLADHAVLLVGYGYDTASKSPYWIIRNSWGEEWGEDGYMRVKRGTDNNCLKPCHAFYLRAKSDVIVGHRTPDKVGRRNSAVVRHNMDCLIMSFIVILSYIMRNKLLLRYQSSRTIPIYNTI